MATGLTRFTDEARIALEGIGERATGLLQPSLRLGVTGLSRAGKTVFITALVHNLLNGGRLPVFEAQRNNRISRVTLDPQPDDAVPRFQYEDHLRALVNDRVWPQSTRAISELRLTIAYQSASGWNRLFRPGHLSIDLIDYPGEWLLDLPLLSQDFAEFSRRAFALATRPSRQILAEEFLALASLADADAPADEADARRLATAFTAYLRACRSDENALSTLPPGRFLMPGDLDGSPALTFAPLPPSPNGTSRKGSLRAMMERRYEAYKDIVVRPFFRDHFARLDRQIVLIDALQAMDRGPEAVLDLETALSDVLACFRPGRNSLLGSLFLRRIDKVLIAATKADHLHHENHARLEALTRRLTRRALDRIGSSGAGVDVMALASVRATREATGRHDGADLPLITGTPMAGEVIGDDRFDGTQRTAVFSGDLPTDPEAYFRSVDAGLPNDAGHEIRILRFRPPALEPTENGLVLSIPHIRLDRALQFLIGDRLA